MTSATKYSLRFFFIRDLLWKESEESRSAGSGAPLVAGVGSLLGALLTQHHATESANDADEGPAVRARVPFGRALLVVTGATSHRVAFAENRGHCYDWYRREPKGFVFRTVNLYYGPHLTTRFAAISQLARRSGPASLHPSGTGA